MNVLVVGLVLCRLRLSAVEGNVIVNVKGTGCDWNRMSSLSSSNGSMHFLIVSLLVLEERVEQVWGGS